jgi:hypothetical protein
MAMPTTAARRGMRSRHPSELDRRIVREFEAAKARMVEMAGREGGLWRRLKLVWAARWTWAGTVVRN